MRCAVRSEQAKRSRAHGPRVPASPRLPISPSPHQVSPELLQLFCELLASAGKISLSAGGHEPLVRLLSRMAPGLPAWLFEKRFRVGPFIENIDARRIFPGSGEPYQVLRRRWRLLRKSMTSGSGAVCGLAGHGLDTTTSDLWFVSKARRRPRRVQSQWRIHGRAVLSRSSDVPEKPLQPLRRLYWGGAGSHKIAFWEKLISTQAGELAEVRRLAGEVGRRTGRVVLSWHNASLGAAGGWGFEETAAQFKSPALYGRFVRAVREEAAQIRKSFDFSAAMDLFDLRSDRIFAPKMVRAVEHWKVCADLPAWPENPPCLSLEKGGILGGCWDAETRRRGDAVKPRRPVVFFRAPASGRKPNGPGRSAPTSFYLPNRSGRGLTRRARVGRRASFCSLRLQTRGSECSIPANSIRWSCPG